MELWSQPADWPFCMKVPPIVKGEKCGDRVVRSVAGDYVHLRGPDGSLLALPLNHYLNWREAGFRVA